MIAIRGSLLTMVIALGSAPQAQAAEASLNCKAGVQHLSANSGRPLAAAVGVLQTRAGLSVTFEEAPIQYRGDIIDVTAPAYQSLSPDKHVFDPRGGVLDATWPARACSGRVEDPSTALDALLKEYHHRGYPGEYRYIKIGNVFHIVPVACADKTGAVRKVTPILDHKVNLPALSRSLDEYIKAVLKGVSVSSGFDVALASGPINFLMQTKTDVGCPDRPARDCLREVLAKDGVQHTWLVMFGAAGHPPYFFNVR